MVLTPVSKTVILNDKESLLLSANLNGQVQSNFENKAKWISADATIAEVDAETEEVTAKLVGATMITGSCGIERRPLSFIQIRDANSNVIQSIDFTINKGVAKNTRLTLYAHYSDGSVVNVSTMVAGNRWSSVLISGFDGAITINANNGVVTANSQSRSEITAKYKNRVDTVIFTVIEN